MNPFLFLRHLLVRREMTHDEVPPERENADAESAEPVDISVLNVGTWTGWGSMVTDKAASRDIKFALDLGLTRLDVMVNDHAKSRDPRRFDTYREARIVSLCRMARGAGLQVHLTSWIMPHDDYIAEAAEQLLEIADSVGASSIMFDAEEPWTQARGKVSYPEASIQVAEAFARVPWGVTGIGYAPADKLAPLVRKSAYMAPQCYSTTSSGLDPATASSKLSERWRKHIADRDLVIGLAAYRQNAIPGYSVADAVRTAFHAARSTGTKDIVYWSLRHLRSNSTVAKAVRQAIEATR